MLAVVMVNTDQDVVDFSDGLTSLREAIFATNTVPGADEIRFDLGHDGPATILLTQGELQITDSLTITGDGADLLTIDASGNDPTPDAPKGDGSRVFTIDDRSDSRNSDVEISGVTLTGANSNAQGGAIYNREDLVIRDSVITDNFARHGGGIYSSVGALQVHASDISNNRARLGGGVASMWAPLSGTSRVITRIIILDSLIADNLATHSGGGIHGFLADSGDLQIDIIRSTIRGNVVDASEFGSDGGGGISLDGGRLTLTDSLLGWNHSETNGGGVLINQGRLSRNNEILVNNSTITRNTAAGFGGGIAALQTIEINHSTIANNRADTNGDGSGTGGGVAQLGGTAIFNHALLSNNVVTVEREQDDFSWSGFARGVATYSLIEKVSPSQDAPNWLPDGNTIVGVDPLLAGFEENGGPTLTHALRPGSVAINAGDPHALAGNDGVPAFDQRGLHFARIVGRIDIGAYESQSVDLKVDTLVDESDGDFSRGDFSLREAIEQANANPLTDTIHFASELVGGTILLTRGELGVHDTVTVNGLGAENLTIDASGNDPTPEEDLGDGSRIFGIVYLNLRQVPKLSVKHVTLTGGDSQGRGGAIHAPYGLSLSGVRLIDSFTSSFGGGAYVEVQLSVEASSVINNRASRHGGGIFARSTTTHVANSQFLQNVSGEFGGGASLSGTNAIFNTRFENNYSAGDAGGAFIGGTNEITNVRVYNNSALGSGGGLHLGDYHSKSRVENGEFIGNSSGESGAGLYTESSAMIIRSKFTGNTAARSGGGAFLGESRILASEFENNHAEQGGGIAGANTPGFMIIEATRVEGNTATHSGGGIASYDDALISNSVVAMNTAGGLSRPNEENISGGGGIYSQYGIALRNTQLVNNTSHHDGGGLHTFFGSSSIEQSTVTGNTAEGSGGGIYANSRQLEDIHGRVVLNGSTIANNFAREHGGGVASIDSNDVNSSVRIGDRIISSSSTISGNRAGMDGGAIYVSTYVHPYTNYANNTTISIRNSTITNNTSDSDLDGNGTGGGIRFQHGTTNLDHSIVAGNQDKSGVANEIASVVNSRFSLVGFGAAFLGPLTENGGPTQTHALLPGSPALSAGDPNLQPGAVGLPEFDQRGAPFGRIVGGRIDIGAYESQPATGILSADFDADGDTDGADFLAWQRGVGFTRVATHADGDATGDEDVDGNDLAVWVATFGNQVPGNNPIVNNNVVDSAPGFPFEFAQRVLREKWKVEPSQQQVFQRDRAIERNYGSSIMVDTIAKPTRTPTIRPMVDLLVSVKDRPVVSLVLDAVFERWDDNL